MSPPVWCGGPGESASRRLQVFAGRRIAIPSESRHDFSSRICQRGWTDSVQRDRRIGGFSGWSDVPPTGLQRRHDVLRFLWQMKPSLPEDLARRPDQTRTRVLASRVGCTVPAACQSDSGDHSRPVEVNGCSGADRMLRGDFQVADRIGPGVVRAPTATTAEGSSPSSVLAV